MRVTLQRDGGFAAVPGLQRPIIVDAGALSDVLRRELAALVAALPDAAPDTPVHRGPPSPVRDGRAYVLQIADGGREQILRFADPVEDPRLRAVRDFVAAHGTVA